MSEYVITKEQLERALYRAFTLEDSRDILTRPLSSALKQEYERGYTDGQKGIKHIKTY